MRISLKIPREPLCSALSDLLGSAGHLVLKGPSDTPPDLVIATQDEGEGRPKGVPALLLGARTGPGGQLAAKVEEALRTRSTVALDSPVDPQALLLALGPVQHAPAGTRDETEPDGAGPFLMRAQHPWLVLEVTTRSVRWGNTTARLRLAQHGNDLTRAFVVPEAVFLHAEGAVGVELDGRPACATWWTVPFQARCLGWIPLPTDLASGAPDNLAALADIGRATATFAHELRNPLASLAGALDLLAVEMIPPEREEVAALGKTRLLQMQRLLDDTLRFARPFRGTPQPVDLPLIVRAVVGGAKLDPLFRGIAIDVEATRDLPQVIAHEQPLQQALTNLLRNAVEAQPQGGAIRVRVSREPSFAVVRVADDGPGIRGPEREKAFSAFWTTKPRGTGLGLPFVRRVAEAAGGRAILEDTNRGTCVRMDLPFAC